MERRREEIKKLFSVAMVLLVVFRMIVSVHAITWLKEDVGNVHGNVMAVAVGDPDNDGVNEIVSGDTAKQVVVYKKVADTWEKHVVTSDAGATIVDLEIGDADNDNENEIVVVTGIGDARVLIFNGSCNSWAMYVIDSIMAGFGATIAIGDADNDGENEIVVGTTDSDLYLLEGSGDSWTKRVLSTDLEGMISGTAIGDADNDGNNEIIAGSLGRNLYMFYGAGSNWSNVSLWSDIDWPVRDVAIGDADNDGENEIVVGTGHSVGGYGYTSGGGAYLYKFVNGAWYEYNMGSTGQGYYIDKIGIHDIDDDGDKEVVAGWGGAPNYFQYGRVKLGNGSYSDWTWTEVTYTVCETRDATRFCVRDLDGDNYMEMVFAETGRTYIRVIYGEEGFQARALTFSVVKNGKTYNVITLSNSNVTSFDFDESLKEISFNVTGPSGSIAFCNVTIPKTLLNAPTDRWTVLVDGQSVIPTVSENDTDSFIYFTYSTSTRTVKIKTLPYAPVDYSLYVIIVFIVVAAGMIIFLAKRKTRALSQMTENRLSFVKHLVSLYHLVALEPFLVFTQFWRKNQRRYMNFLGNERCSSFLSFSYRN